MCECVHVSCYIVSQENLFKTWLLAEKCRITFKTLAAYKELHNCFEKNMHLSFQGCNIVKNNMIPKMIQFLFFNTKNY